MALPLKESKRYAKTKSRENNVEKKYFVSFENKKKEAIN